MTEQQIGIYKFLRGRNIPALQAFNKARSYVPLPESDWQNKFPLLVE